jgi:hypothetical protein
MKAPHSLRTLESEIKKLSRKSESAPASSASKGRATRTMWSLERLAGMIPKGTLSLYAAPTTGSSTGSASSPSPTDTKPSEHGKSLTKCSPHEQAPELDPGKSLTDEFLST